MSWIRDFFVSRYGLLLAALAVVGLADWLVYDALVLGVNLAILATVILVLLLLQHPRLHQSRPGQLVIVWTFGTILSLIEQPGILGLILCTWGLVTAALLARLGWREELSIWFKRWGRWLALGWLALFRDLAVWRRWEARRDTKGTSAAILRWIIPILVAVVFLALFRLANPLIEMVLQGAVELFYDLRFPAWQRMLFWACAMMLLWGLLRVRRRRETKARLQPPPVPGGRSGLGLGLVLRCLILCNLVFLIQNLLDSGFLWGGLALPSGTTYAEYAHRGAYPLIATALLAAVFVLIAFRPNGPAHRSPAARSLVYAWLAQNVFLTLSAFWRLHLYVEAYSLTRLRVAAGIWMGLVALGLILIIWRIRAGRSNVWLLRSNLAAVSLVFFCCSFVNFDGFIAKFNVNAYLAEKNLVEIDLAYLKTLGPEALPALQQLANAGAPVPSHVAASAATVKQNMETELTQKLRDWRAWTWRRQRLQQFVAPEAQAWSSRSQAKKLPPGWRNSAAILSL